MQKGILITCDVGVKEYLVWLDRSGIIPSFLLFEIDDRHLFVQSRPNLFEELQECLDAWMDSNSFSAMEELEMQQQLQALKAKHGSAAGGQQSATTSSQRQR